MRPDELERIEAAMRERVAALPPRPADGWARVERRIRRYRMQRAATAAGAALAAALALAVLFTMPPKPGPVVVRPGPVTTVTGPAPTTTSTTTPPTRKAAAGRTPTGPEGATGATRAGTPAGPGTGRQAATGPGTTRPDRNSGPSATAPVDPGPRPGNRLTLTSEAGEPVAQGQPVDLTDPEMQFGFLPEPYAPEGGVRMWITNPTPLDWTIDLAPPRGESLHAGAYTGATLPGDSSGREPVLRVARNDRGCDKVFGSFTIHRIEPGEEGLPSLLDVSFVQHCGTPDGPALRGRVWITQRP